MSSMRQARNEVWSFRTDNLEVALVVEPEDMDPADSFDHPDDIAAVRSGAVEWFQARVVVRLVEGLDELGADSLGACAYDSVRQFYTSHRDPDPLNRNCTIMRAQPGQERTSICHYFPDMVRGAVLEARKQLAAIKAIPLREVQP